MKIYKVADIVEGEIALTERGKSRSPHPAAVLTNLEPVENPNSDFIWVLELEVGEGASARNVKLDLPPLISNSDSLDQPIFIGNSPLVFFRNRLFMSERLPKNEAEREEVVLRTKKAVYGEEAEIYSIRAAVANLEAAIEFTRSGPRREPIPEDVKLVVWARDGGSCVRCGSKVSLHFDHIIPVAKGGANTEENIQILCQVCNLKKSDKIATPQ